MSKNLSKIQKIICFMFLLGAALMIVGALVYVNDDWNIFTADYTSNFYRTLQNSITTARDIALKEQGKSYIFIYKYENCFSYVFKTAGEASNYYINLWNSIQDANNMLFFTGLIGIVGIAICGVLGQFSHRKYYISNLIGGLLISVIGIGMSISSIVLDLKVMNKLSLIGPDVSIYNNAMYATTPDHIFNEVFVNVEAGLIAITFSIIFIVICVLFSAFTVYKYNLSRKQIRMEACLDE